MSIYIYFGLGIVLGIAIAVYFFADREEKIHRKMILDKRIYSTKKLDNTMEHIINRINYNIEEAKRELTEEEKNEIIKQCYKEKFNVW